MNTPSVQQIDSPSTVHRQFQPGFRLSSLDVAVLVLGVLGAGVAGLTISAWLAAGVLFVVGHFFLFCNVFRISRGPELAWAALFVSMSLGTVLMSVPGWPATFVVAVGVSVAVILLEMRKPSYHGVAWRAINPKLPECWDRKQAEEA